MLARSRLEPAAERIDKCPILKARREKLVNNAYDEFRAIVNERGNALRKFNYEQLSKLEERPVEYVNIEKRKGRIATYLDKTLPSGGVMVVVQGFLPKRFFPMIWNVAIDGFYKYPDDTTAPLTQEDIWRFD